jgi:hypothetical protein
MNAHSIVSPGALVLRVLTSCLFALLVLLPLILKLWRGQTTEDRSAMAREERERAEMVADTTIAVKRAEVRAEIETMWAEQQLASARLAVEAQNEIDRETQRRRVAEVLEAPMPLSVESERIVEPVAELPAAEQSDNLPALVDPPEPRERGLIPVIPDGVVAATRWIRPFVPPIVASAIETSTRPLRGSRQLFEETEEIHFSLRRSHRVAVVSEETGEESTHTISVEASPAAVVRADRPDRKARSELGKSAKRRELPAGDS